MSEPTFSIVIPTYNHAHLLNRCIDSLIAQTFTDWEAIIVNNFSEDNTVPIVEAYNDPRIQIINFRNNGIIAASRNEGIRQSKGHFVAFLDSDDWWHSEKLVTVAELTPEYDLIYHSLELVFQHKKNIFKKYLRPRQLQVPIHKDLLLNGNCIPNSAAVIRRNILVELGGLDENPQIIALEDYDLWVRIGKVSNRFMYIPQSLGYYWIGGNNMSQASEKQLIRYTAFYAKHLPSLSEQEAKEVLPMKNYTEGRILEKMGRPSEAVKRYAVALKTTRLSLRAKSAILFVFCSVKSIGKGRP